MHCWPCFAIFLPKTSIFCKFLGNYFLVCVKKLVHLLFKPRTPSLLKQDTHVVSRRDNRTQIYYSWIGPPVETHKKSICRRTRRVTTIPRPPLESSRRGESRSAWYIFVKFISGLLIFETSGKIKYDNLGHKLSKYGSILVPYHVTGSVTLVLERHTMC